ncbi:DMT family transporter [Thalassobius sp. Cn5-15]|uniref:DMT family transporter n=1 Tax=Thalassobius sp. Cn5-15 TaxID=2917763 RepID=UPI001EF38E22|nr:DMT family transporter [Thalassobius sp. Cn5-15]MCG7493712.1 DMT family transporter [Thalassobius sp. Cn5-15]
MIPQIPAPNPRLAMVLMLSSTAFMAATTLMAKALGTDTLGDPLHPLQISHGRFIFAFLFYATAAVVVRLRVRRPALHLHLGRTLFGWGGVSCLFAAATFIPLGDATAISFLNPVFAMMLAIPLLGERVGPWRWAAAGVALIGALVLLRPTPDSFQPAALIALASALLFGMEIIFIKKLAGREGPFQILLINNGLGVVISSLAVIAFWQVPSMAQWAVMGSLGLCMAMAQACFINAVARAETSFVAPFSYATLVFASLYDWAVFTQIPDAISYLGAGIIISGAALLAWREALAAARAFP